MGRHLDANPKAEAAEVVVALLDRIPEKPVSLEEARRALRSEPLPGGAGGGEEESRKLVIAMRKDRKLRKALDVVPWSRFDTIRRDGRLDRDELHRFVEALVRGAATHDIATEHPEQEPLQTHPSTRKRIVYLYLHFLASEGTRAPPASLN